MISCWQFFRSLRCPHHATSIHSYLTAFQYVWRKYLHFLSKNRHKMHAKCYQACEIIIFYISHKSSFFVFESLLKSRHLFAVFRKECQNIHAKRFDFISSIFEALTLNCKVSNWKSYWKKYIILNWWITVLKLDFSTRVLLLLLHNGASCPQKGKKPENYSVYQTWKSVTYLSKERTE